MKGVDKSPFNAESLCKNWIGPDMKNLLIPKDEENRLKQKVRRGNAELKSLYVVFINWPSICFGKNPSIAKRIAKDMFT